MNFEGMNFMKQSYKIDRLNLITYKHQKKKHLQSINSRYIAKSHIVNCLAVNQSFKYVNYRGSIITKVKFNNVFFYCCDFWGKSFNKCEFRNISFDNCIFMACKFKNREFINCNFSFTTIVNTNLSFCQGIDISSGVFYYRTYPNINVNEELKNALDVIKYDFNLRKNKLLFISEYKYNKLNLYLLKKKFKEELPDVLIELKNHSTKNITTYKKLELVLYKFKNMI